MQIRTEAQFKSHPSRSQIYQRHIFLGLLRSIPLLLPREAEIDPAVLERVNRLSREGQGVLFAATHFGQRELIEYPLAAARFHELLKRRVDVPVALHQAHRRSLRILVTAIAGNFWPVFTEDTAKVLEQGKDTRAQGARPTRQEIVTMNEAYFAASRECLQIGGTVFVAIKPGRRPVLELTLDKPLQRLLMRKDESGAFVDNPNVVLVLVGLSLYNHQVERVRTDLNESERKREEERRYENYRKLYEAHNRFNLARKLDLRINIALTQPERQALVEKTRLSIDNLATALLATQVDDRYAAVPRDVVSNAMNAYLNLER